MSTVGSGAQVEIVTTGSRLGARRGAPRWVAVAHVEDERGGVEPIDDPDDLGLADGVAPTVPVAIGLDCVGYGLKRGTGGAQLSHSGSQALITLAALDEALSRAWLSLRLRKALRVDASSPSVDCGYRRRLASISRDSEGDAALPDFGEGEAFGAKLSGSLAAA